MRAGTLGFTLVADCPECEGGQLRVRTRRSDGEPFISCSRFPLCRCAMPYVEGLDEIRGELEQLRGELRWLRTQRPAPQQALPEAAAERLRALLVRFHPDKRGVTVPTIEVAQAVGEIFNLVRKVGPR